MFAADASLRRRGAARGATVLARRQPLGAPAKVKKVVTTRVAVTVPVWVRLDGPRRGRRRTYFVPVPT
jgi:hypothetical protein